MFGTVEVHGELAAFIRGDEKLSCPVYTVVGSFEDHRVVGKFLNKSYQVANLNIIHPTATYLIANNIRFVPVRASPSCLEIWLIAKHRAIAY